MSFVKDIQNDLENTALRLFLEYRDRLYAEAVRLCGDLTEAEDLVMRTMDAALRDAEHFDAGKGELYSWLKGILVHQFHRTRLRAVNRGTSPVDPQTMEEVGGEDNRTEEQILRNADHDALREAIEQLDPKYRQAVVLHYFGDLSIKEIAGLLDKPIGTVSRRLQIARQILAAKLATKFGRKPVAVLLAILLAVGTLWGAWQTGFGEWLSGDVDRNAELQADHLNREGQVSIHEVQAAEVEMDGPDEPVFGQQQENDGMKASLRRGLLSATMAAALTSVSATAGAGSVYDDCRFWFNGGVDADGSGVFKTGDFTDVFHVADPSHELNQQGIHGCTTPGDAFSATTTLKEIVLPMTGEAKTLRVVSLPQAAKPNAGATDYQLWPNSCGFETAGAYLCVTDSYTFVWRLKRHGLSHGKTKSFILDGMAYGANKGFDLLLDADGVLCSQTRYRGNPQGTPWRNWGDDAKLPDEEWVDLAVVMKGKNPTLDGAVATLYMKTASGAFTRYDSAGDVWGNLSLATTAQNSRSLEIFHNIRQDSARWLGNSAGWGLEFGLPVEFQQFVVWDRCLDEAEIKEAFGLSNGHLLGTGRFDGSSDDLGGGKTTAFTITEDVDGRVAPSVIAARSEIAYAFNLTRLDPSYAFFVGTAAGSPTGTFEVLLNGEACATKTIPGGAVAAFVAKTAFFKTGTNVITLRRVDAGADVMLDAVRLESTWQIGMRDNAWNEFGDMGVVGGAYDVRNNYCGADLKKVRNGVRLHSQWTHMRNNVLYVPISAEMAVNCTLSYTLRATAWSDDPAQPATIKLMVNGAEKLSLSSSDIAAGWTDVTATFAPGELKAGLNEFKWTISGDRADNDPTIGFDCHVFSLTPDRKGLLIVIK